MQVDDDEPGMLAGRGRRLVGAIIDGLVMIIVVIPITIAMGYWDRVLEEQNTLEDTLLFTVISCIAFLLVNGYLLANRGQTVGKMMLSMRIVSFQDNRILPVGRLLGLRYIPQWVIGSVPVVGGLLALVNILFIFGEQRRCVHDLIAGTKVVMTE